MGEEEEKTEKEDKADDEKRVGNEDEDNLN
jgi:hypothetical protein